MKIYDMNLRVYVQHSLLLSKNKDSCKKKCVKREGVFLFIQMWINLVSDLTLLVQGVQCPPPIPLYW